MKAQITTYDDDGCRTTWQVEVVAWGETPEGDAWVLIKGKNYE